MFLSNRLMHLRYLLLVAVCVAVPALSQNICRISHREGFSNCSILSLAQDADGYVWAGSCDGLNLWDGHYARNFRLSGNLVQEIVATDDGYLWVRTNYGVDRVDARARTAELHADFPRVYQYTARSRDEAFFLYKGRLYGYVASESRFEPLCGVDADDVLRICLDPDGVLWFVRRDGMDCAPVVYDAEGRAVLGAWKHIPVRNGISFVRYDGDRTVYFVDGAGRLCRFDTERQLTSAICGLAQELERRGELAAVIRDGDDYVLAFEMGGVLRLHASGSESGGYTLREIDVACGVFSLLKDWNQDIVWIGTDGSGLLRQSAGDIAVRSITYDMLPYKLTKPIKALFVDERGNLWVGTKNDGILCIRDFHAQRAFGRENTRNFIAENTAPCVRIQSMPLPRAGAVCCGSGATAGCAIIPMATDASMPWRAVSSWRMYTACTKMLPGCCGRQRSVAEYTASSLQATQAPPLPGWPSPWIWGAGSGAGISFSRSARSPIRRCGSATTASGRCDTINTHAGAR